MLALAPIALCLAAALVVAGLPDFARHGARNLTLGALLFCLGANLYALFAFPIGTDATISAITIPWIPQFGIYFATGLNGLGLALCLLTSVVGICGVLIAWRTEHRPQHFFALYLVLLAGVYGVFVSRDAFLLFVFYEIAIVPKYFLIALWGGANRDRAAMKLVLYSFAGSALVFFGLIASGTDSFLLSELVASDSILNPVITVGCLVVGFGVLAGMWPFHTWAPTGHVAAPTAVSMLLAGVVMKLGAFAILVVALPMSPDAALTLSPYLAGLAIIGILYGAVAAMRQSDFKFVVGYSSVSHMGFVLLGLATLDRIGVTGAALQMVSHGILGALLFAMVGTVIYSRTGTRQLDELDNLARRMPAIATLTVIAVLAAMGLPGFSGFAAELFVLIGAWRNAVSDSGTLFLIFPLLAGLGIVLSFGYALAQMHGALFTDALRPSGKLPPERYPPLRWNEWTVALVLLALALFLGLFPHLLAGLVQPALPDLQFIR